MADKKRCCAKCIFGEDLGNGFCVCRDYDGLYFTKWLKCVDKCPDFKKKKDVEDKEPD